VQVTPSQGRRAISYLTLFGGFASSVFWPVGHALGGWIGWRGAFLVFAGLNLLVCLPLHWAALANREPEAAKASDADQSSGTATDSARRDALTGGPSRRVALALFAVVMSACAFVFGALAVLLPGLLEAHGISAAAAVTLAAIKGVAQVGGRFADVVYGQTLAPLTLGRIAVGLLPVSFVFLLGGYLAPSLTPSVAPSFWAIVAFTILFGISNGLVTIVRGAVPLALFGTTGYGAILGLLATPYLLLNATAPVVIALIVERWGYGVAEAVMFVTGLVGLVTLEILIRWQNRAVRL
jgi:predicted MFS family arabinose efflux permease